MAQFAVAPIRNTHTFSGCPLQGTPRWLLQPLALSLVALQHGLRAPFSEVPRPLCRSVVLLSRHLWKMTPKTGWKLPANGNYINNQQLQPSKNGVFPEIHRSWWLGEEMLFKLLKIPQKNLPLVAPKKANKTWPSQTWQNRNLLTAEMWRCTPVCHGDVPRWWIPWISEAFFAIKPARLGGLPKPVF